MNLLRRRPILAAVAILTIGVAVAICWFFDLGHAPVEAIPSLDGKAISEVVRILGEPDSDHSYTMDKYPGGELGMWLCELYPHDRPESRDVAIRELWWEHNRFTVVVWFHKVGEQWVALDTCRWQKGVVF